MPRTERCGTQRPGQHGADAELTSGGSRGAGAPRHRFQGRAQMPSCGPVSRWVTESQNHRMVGVGRDLCGSPSPTLRPAAPASRWQPWERPCFQFSRASPGKRAAPLPPAQLSLENAWPFRAPIASEKTRAYRRAQMLLIRARTPSRGKKSTDPGSAAGEKGPFT